MSESNRSLVIVDCYIPPRSQDKTLNIIIKKVLGALKHYQLQDNQELHTYMPNISVAVKG